MSPQRSVTTDPPQMGYVFSLSDSCHGTADIDVFCPDTIRLVEPAYRKRKSKVSNTGMVMLFTWSQENMALLHTKTNYKKKTNTKKHNTAIRQYEISR